MSPKSVGTVCARQADVPRGSQRPNPEYFEMMDLLFKSQMGINSLITLGFLIFMGVGLFWWVKRKMDNPED